MAKWGGPSDNLTWPLKPSKKPKAKIKQKNKENKKKDQNQKKTNKEGLGPSEVALWAASPDP